MWKLITGGCCIFLAAGIAVFIMDSLLSWFKLMIFSTVQATIISYGIILALIATGSIFFGIREGEHKQKKKKDGVQEEVNSQQESSLVIKPVAAR
jgi:predicted PurR-regulated permease PerM